MTNLQSLEQKLFELDPDSDDFELQMDDFIDSLPAQYQEDIIPAIFLFFEKYPLNQEGCPGTFTHFIEDFYPNYIDILLASIERKPSFFSLLMVNRILNDSKISANLRTQLTTLLESVVSNKTHAELATEAQELLDYQEQKILKKIS